jgi:hypothetical protein
LSRGAAGWLLLASSTARTRGRNGRGCRLIDEVPQTIWVNTCGIGGACRLRTR